MCVGAAVLAIASSGQGPAAHSLGGVWAALGAGILWGTMYIPYRKAYLTGMNPLSFVTFFTFGELGMMTALAISTLGVRPLWQELASAHGVMFWLMLGGFIWVIGDLFQQYAAKYVGISRGIPLSNTNQLWGMLWGILVFGELHGRGHATYAQVIGGSLLMMLGVGAIALSSATSKEQSRWKRCGAARERQIRGRAGICASPNGWAASHWRSSAKTKSGGLDLDRRRDCRVCGIRQNRARSGVVDSLGAGVGAGRGDADFAGGVRPGDLEDDKL